MKILFATLEVQPFAKTGGVADVMAVLPRKLKELGHDVRVVLPHYKTMPEKYSSKLKKLGHFQLEMGYKSEYCGIKELEHDGIKYYFINNDTYFFRKDLYGYADDGERFAFYTMAVCEMLSKVDFIPDILHSNSWRAAMIPFLLVHKYNNIKEYKNIKKVFTINNMYFQGEFDKSIIKNAFNLDYNIYSDGSIEHDNKVNFLKAAINYSDRIITVSPTYAKEIQTPQHGLGLDYVLRHNSWKIRGILNGFSIKDYNHIDYKLNTNTKAKDYIKSKNKSKKQLQKELNLKVDEDVLLIGMVGRFNHQKGTILLLDKFDELMKRKIQIVALGMGDNNYESRFIDNVKRYPNRASINIDFDSTMAQKIYSSCDIFLMPSLFEPCGIAQLIAYTHGAVPLVHETGGLKDTVIPYNKFTKEGTGFSFNNFNSDALLHVLDYALSIYYDDKESWNELVIKAANLDFGWDKSVMLYNDLYNEVINE